MNLSNLYASHPNLVAQQVYVTAMVYTAFRVAQARIAERLRILPEQLSPAKLFPKLALAINDYCVVQRFVIRTRELNPGVAIRFPGMSTVQSASVPLDAILLRRRNGNRRRRRFCASAKRWKSFKHVRGGQKFLRLASHG
ncbi:hypothetical protein EPO44_09075 [bacterium]|nr:MAG: hypothetical protein EPO44_09075 [bacterium]